MFIYCCAADRESISCCVDVEFDCTYVYLVSRRSLYFNVLLPLLRVSSHIYKCLSHINPDCPFFSFSVRFIFSRLLGNSVIESNKIATSMFVAFCTMALLGDRAIVGKIPFRIFVAFWTIVFVYVFLYDY